MGSSRAGLLFDMVEATWGSLEDVSAPPMEKRQIVHTTHQNNGWCECARCIAGITNLHWRRVCAVLDYLLQHPDKAASHNTTITFVGGQRRLLRPLYDVLEREPMLRIPVPISAPM